MVVQVRPKPSEKEARPPRKEEVRSPPPDKTVEATADQTERPADEVPAKEIDPRAAIAAAVKGLVIATKKAAGQPAVADLASFLDTIIENSGPPITGPGGILERPQEQREIMCLFQNGLLLVSRSHLSDPYVLKLESYARLRGIPIERAIPVSLETLREVYGRAGSNQQKASSITQMQRDITRLVTDAVQENSSDIHIIVESRRCIVEMRMNGVLRQKLEWRAEYGSDFCAACFAMADASDANYNPNEYQAARISRETAELPEEVQALRLQFNPLAYGGRYLIMRLLYRGSSSGRERGNPRKLGYVDTQLKALEKMCATPVGIGIVSGPTGSGKSTTLFHLLSQTMEQCNYERNTITIEDPPERPIFGAKQMPVTNAQSPAERAKKFIQAISAAMRSDPDTIMIGEVRDQASASLAIEAAMTGHQVWTTVHANDALMIVNRLRDIGVEEYNLFTPGMIFGLIGQRLARRLCDNCKYPVEKANEEGKISSGLWERLNEVVDLKAQQIYWPGDGCEVCGVAKGYTGRTVVAEVIYPDVQLMNHLRNDDRVGARRYWIKELGGMSMMIHSLGKLMEGKISPAEIERVVGPIELTEEERF